MKGWPDRFSVAVGALSVWLASGAAHAANPDAIACSADVSSAVLQSEVGGDELIARAVWINERRLRWPSGSRPNEASATNDGAYQLLVTDDASLRVTLGAAMPPASPASAIFTLTPDQNPLSEDALRAIRYVGGGIDLRLTEQARESLKELHKRRLVLVEVDRDGIVRRAARIQRARALDALYADAAAEVPLGFTRVRAQPASGRFQVWAPTARRAVLCGYSDATGGKVEAHTMVEDTATGVWRITLDGKLLPKYYTYLVETWVDGVGFVRNRVTDPYAISLSANSKRSFVADLDDADLKPAGWDKRARRPALRAPTDLVIYELHLRDFSISDSTVPNAHRGKYLAFTHPRSNGMKHLKQLAVAGVTDVHLLPVFDIATIDEERCQSVSVDGLAASTAPREIVARTKERDCYNWGYDPYHYTAPEGSYATNANNGATRVREFRQMVLAMNAAGLRVGMDVVYNHTAQSGQREKSVLDRIVPGYYHRLSADGKVETSTCCDNTATEHRMMEKLMSDSVVAWAKHYRIDSFRFDLMGHQPRAAMERLRDRLRREIGRDVPLIGEGWNFGEIADGKRFVQASQLSLPGSGIATFSDRARDAARGGGHADSGANLVALQGYLNGLGTHANALNQGRDQRDALLRASDLIRVGLLGSVREATMVDRTGKRVPLSAIDYNGQPGGYVAEPGEVVNYVENHDNQTLFDINALRLPRETSKDDRARMQVLGGAITLFSQGIPYVHAGIEILRSKSLDRNSFDSGDHFNRLDWTYRSNHFARGLPPVEGEGGRDDSILAEALNDSRIAPTTKGILWTRNAFLDLLRIRASSTLFRLRSAQDIMTRVSLINTGPNQVPGVLGAVIDGKGYVGANAARLAYFINAATESRTITIEGERDMAFELHGVHKRPDAADQRIRREARFDRQQGAFHIPARSAVVFVVR